MIYAPYKSTYTTISDSNKKYINQCRSKKLYDKLINWVGANPLEVNVYGIEYKLYNQLTLQNNRIEFGIFIFYHNRYRYNLNFQIQNVIKIESFIGLNVGLLEDKLMFEGSTYYSIYKDDITQQYSLYSDYPLNSHDNLLDWFINVAKIMNNSTDKVLQLT